VAIYEGCRTRSKANPGTAAPVTIFKIWLNQHRRLSLCTTGTVKMSPRAAGSWGKMTIRHKPNVSVIEVAPPDARPQEGVAL
jgi:hypothetical protein